jgi:hypothetical protein
MSRRRKESPGRQASSGREEGADAPRARRAPVDAPSSIRIQAALAALVAFVVYAFTCARTVTFDDSGELILSSVTLGIAHPPGFPTYTLLGNLFSRLPVGSVALRFALLSATSAAAVAGLAVLILGELSRAAPGKSAPGDDDAPGASREGAKAGRRRSRKTREGGPESVPARLLGCWPMAAALAIAFGSTLWSYATLAEVYTLNLALIAAAWWLLLVWQRQLGAGEPGRATGTLAVLGLVTGLALAVHHTTVLLAIPALLLLMARTAGVRHHLFGRPSLVAAAALCAGLAVYLYLPWAASRDPLQAWGVPMTWLRFRQHVSAQIYQGYILAKGLDGVSDKLALVTRLWLRDVTPAIALLAPIGLVALRRRRPPVLHSFLVLAAMSLAWALLYHNDENWDAHTMPLLLVSDLVGGCGLAACAGRAQRAGRSAQRAALLLMVAWPAASLFLHFRESDRSSDRTAPTFVDDVLRGVEPGGLILTRSWHFASPFLYLHHVEEVRPDVTLIDVNQTRLSWYLRTYLEKTAGPVLDCCRPELDAYLELVDRNESRQPVDRSELERRHHAFLDTLLRSEAGRRAVYWVVPREPRVGERLEWTPFGLTYRLSPPGAASPGEPPTLDLDAVRRPSPFREDVGQRSVRDLYSSMLAQRGRYHLLRGELQRAQEWIDRSLEVAGDRELAYLVLADLRVAQGDRAAAADALEQALVYNPRNEQARRGLASLRRGS